MKSMTFTPNKKAKELHIFQRLQKLAKQMDRSMNWIVMQALLEYFKRHENDNAQ